MNMPLTLLKFRTALLATVLTCGSAWAAEWVSPDGAIAVARPEDRFTEETDLPAPGLVRWVSLDTTKAVVVTQNSLPAGVQLQQRGLEEGTLSQVTGGSIVSSTTWMMSGVPTFTIVVTGNLAGTNMFLAQTITAFDGQVYKVMAVSPTDPIADAEIGPLLNSLRIVKAAPVPPAAAQAPVTPPSERDRANRRSVAIAQFAWLALAAAGVVWFFRRRRRTADKTPPPLPPSARR